MIDLPAGWQEAASKIDWSAVQDKVKDYGPVLQVIQATWDKESLLAISRGKLFVPDDVVNQALARQIPADGPIRSVTIASHADGRMDIMQTPAGLVWWSCLGPCRSLFIREISRI